MTGSEVADRAATNDLPRRATASLLRQPHLSRGEPLLLIGGGGSVGIIATQLAVAQGSP
jgi:NADPH:quinone reductase-like Zn-dependent oxidoreductase